ncbi:MAG: ABC transporter permease subunit [Lachnospiraceae bacterium]|nr:ABC transporter permease subunit [Lachnospiraceae bacterium]
MNKNNIKIMYRKEMLDVIRDKKTMIAMFLLPLIIYPVIFIVVLQIMMMVNTDKEQSIYKVVYTVESREAVNALDKYIKSDEDNLDYIFKFIQVSDKKEAARFLNKEKADIYIEVSEAKDIYTFNISFLSAVNNSTNCLDLFEEELDEYNKLLSKKRVEEKGLDVEYILNPIAKETHDLSSSEKSIGNVLGNIIPFMLMISILMGCTYPAIDATSGEKERGTLETLLTFPITSTELITAKFLSVATLSLVSVLVNVISIGGIILYMYATMRSMMASIGSIHLLEFIPALLVTIICITAFALFVSAIFMCVCSFARSFKEANNYITPVMLIIMFAGYISFIPNITLDYKMALIPVANVCLLIKDLLVLKYELSLIGIVLLVNVLYAMLAIMLLGAIYDSENILFGDGSSIRYFEKRENIKRGGLPTIPEAILVFLVAIIFMVYLGGYLSLRNPVMGVIIPQTFFGVLPIIACLYIKGDFKKTFKLNAPKVPDLIASVFMVLGGYSISMIAGNILTYFFPDKTAGVSSEFGIILDKVPFGVALILIALLPAVCEELYFRGYLLTALSEKLGRGLVYIIAAALFAAAHMSLIRFIPLMILGLYHVYVARKTGSIFNTSLMHFINNGFAVFVMYYGSKYKIFTEMEADKKWYGIFAVTFVIFTVLALVIYNRDKLIKNKEKEA